MRSITVISLIILTIISCKKENEDPPPPPSSPPFSGTIFVDPDIITSSDPSAYVSVNYTGQASRTMYDRRVNDWIVVEPFLFDATFDDGLSIEMQVNPEFGTESAALTEAEKYAMEIGRLPTSLRALVETSWIHKGTQPFGGGNNNILIHTGQAAAYISNGILEETLVHEATHSSIDPLYSSDAGWLAAQEKDPTFISTYARDNPNREDLAESLLLWLAARHRSDRISAELKATIEATMPNRLSFFDSMNLDLYPID